MHLFIAFDGSDDGFEALRSVLSQFDHAKKRRVTVTVIAWPERESPIWDKATIHQADVDDLHRAMAEVGNREVTRVRRLFSDDTAVKTIVADGEPLDVLFRLIASDAPDMILLGVTGGPHRDAVLAVVDEVAKRATRPLVVAHGVRQAKTASSA